MKKLLKNKKNAHIPMNDSHSPMPQVEKKKKQYTTCDIKREDHARWFQHITSQPVKQILHVVDKNNLQNLPILQKDFGMAEDIYGPSVPYL